MSLRTSTLEMMIILLITRLPSSWNMCLTEHTNTSVNYVTNGDFEAPYLGPNRWRSTTDQLYGWTSTKIEQGTGSIYNLNWGSNTQVIEMDTDRNEMYNQTLNLPQSKFSFKISYAARRSRHLNTSGLRIWWNGQVIRDIPTSLDYNIHTETFILQAHEGDNYLILQGAGISDGSGMTCDNIIFNKIESYNRAEVNGQCICNVGYFDDRMNWNCQPCTLMDPECKACSYDPVGDTTNSTNSNNSTNSTNASSFYQFTCQVCGQGFFSQGGSCAPCSVVNPGCYNCSADGQDCYGCNETENYFLQLFSNVTYEGTYNTSNDSNISYGGCVLCSLEQCIACASLSTCLECNNTNNYFLNDSRMLCQPCLLEGCILCSNLTSCAECDNLTYYMANDNNSLCTYCDGSLNMFIQPTNLTCQKCSLTGCQTCADLQSCRKCTPGLYLLNSSMLCEPCQLEGCLLCLTKTSCLTCDQANEFYLNQNGKCIKCISCNCRTGGAIQGKGVPEIVYSEEECQTLKEIEDLATFIGVTSYIIMFFALISVKIVGLELFGVLQLAFFNLADNQFVNIYLSPLLGWKYLNGFNIDLTSSFLVPENVQAIKYSNSFISNINIMFLILLIQFVVAIIFTVLSHKIPVLAKINKFLLHQVFITLFLFNSFNIAFSAGLHFKYANAQNTEYYILSTLAAALGLAFYMAILVLLQRAKQNEFGEFKNKFKKDFVNQIYMSVSVLYRMALGFYMAVSNEQTFGTLFILSFSFIYIMYNIINLPFGDFYQNYRANLCHITQLVILMVTNYYRSMRFNDDLEIKARIHTPAKLELVLIVICVVFSGVCLAYEIFLMLKQRLGKSKITHSEESFQNLTIEQLPVTR